MYTDEDYIKDIEKFEKNKGNVKYTKRCLKRYGMQYYRFNNFVDPIMENKIKD